jgi:hypothetical protein
METPGKTPALSPAQRYFYEVNGYLMLEGVFSEAECRRFIALADQMDADGDCAYKHDGYPKTPALTMLSRCAWYDPHLLDTALHPILLPVIEEVVGGEVRLEEHQFLINYPAPEAGAEVPIRDEGWHRGIAPSFGSFQAERGYCCLFSKAFIYLTDNGPGEGTWVVPGSHKLELPSKALRQFMDQTLARQLQSRAGDVLILSETLIHAGPRLRPGAAPRYSLVYGYTAPYMQTWNRYDPPAALLEKANPAQRRLLSGEARYGFRSGSF